MQETLQQPVQLDFSVNEQELKSVYSQQLAFFNSGATRDLKFRIETLKKLKSAIQQHEVAIEQALYNDLRKSSFEAFGTEVGIIIKEIDFTIKHLEEWSRPQSVPTPLMFFPSTSKIYRDPLGIVLIIAPWNYPFQLVFGPLICAIAGGNTAFIKPSEEAPHTAMIVEKIIEEVFDEQYMHVAQGIGAQIIPLMISTLRFDHIFFTGSTMVGQKIMEMAAKQLVPVTLELGGKSPTIIDASANIDYTAKKIVWSKLINAGQTCIAPDYLLVHSSVKDALLEKIKFHIAKMFGKDVQQSEDYGRIINRKRFQKLISYLEGANIVSGGRHDEKDLFIEPTIIEHPSMDDAIMKEEIFGPILPVISFNEHREVFEWIDKNPFPLALYLFADDKRVQQQYIQQVRFGGCSINNGLVHIGNPHLPFGGVGPSGIGQYHGKFGYENFTRPKSVMVSKSWFDVPLWYAPFKGKTSIIKKVFKFT
jgi:aldehyde dehydrogenase (NAD+)